MDQLIRKKALYLAFSRTYATPQKYVVQGQLIHQGQIISQSSLQAFSGKNGNLFFDLPAQIPDGLYTIAIRLIDSDNNLVAHISKTIDRKEFKRAFQKKSHDTATLPRRIEPVIEDRLYQPLEPGITGKGYIVFQRSPLLYVYPESRPESNEIVTQISVNAVKNEYENIPLSVHAFKDLGAVNVKVEWVDSAPCRINEGDITVSHIESVEDQRGAPRDTYRKIPKLIVPGGRIQIKKDKTERFLLTLHIPEDAVPGETTASIIISPEEGPETHLPLQIRVNNITLEDIPNVHYFMLMTYEFTELVNNWSDNEKKQIYDHAYQVLEDYKAHGMTALCPHSPFIPTEGSNGDIDLTDIKAALIAARDVGLRGPVIWYMGHLIQTAKPRHPGSILGFEPDKSYAVLEKLVKSINKFAHEKNCPQVIFLPIDEPDDNYQDFHGQRFDITNTLLERIKSIGGMTAVSAQSYDAFKHKDFFLSAGYSEKDLQKAHKEGCAYIEYNNKVTTDCNNPVYARFIYGYHVWQSNLDGICSWTFQNTQNASGDPRLSDTIQKDIFLAYPDPKGPISTLSWEAIREGIEDHKLVYQLDKRIDNMRRRDFNTENLRKFLKKIKKRRLNFSCSGSEDNKSASEQFNKIKESTIRMILDADLIQR